MRDLGGNSVSTGVARSRELRALAHLIVAAVLFGAVAVVGLVNVERSGVVSAAGLDAGVVLELQVGGRGGVPLDAAAVVLNTTVVNASAPGYVTVWPCGEPLPDASNLNYAAGQTTPNLVVVKPGVGGKVCFWSYSAVDLLADVSGYFPAGTDYRAVSNPVRILDSRTGNGVTGRVSAGRTVELQVGGRGGVPLDAAAVVLNTTVVNASAPGYVTVWPCGEPLPDASNLNYAAGQTTPNLVVVKPGVGGKVCFWSYSAVDLLADVSGYFPRARIIDRYRTRSESSTHAAVMV